MPLEVGEVLTISGFITPAPSLPDYVVVQAGESDSTTAIDGVAVPLAPDGSFSYYIVVSPLWDAGQYLITVTDSSGVTGISSFFILPQS